MRVLITGITGFVGGFLAEECARQGWEVHGTTHTHDQALSSPGGDAPPLPDAVRRAALHRVDLTDGPATAAVFTAAQPDLVYHLKDGPHLYNHGRKAIVRHVKVKGTKSPYDSDVTYWTTRLGRHPDLSGEVARLLKRQKGTCPWCGRYFTTEDIKEKDHVIPKARRIAVGWTETQLLHGHCHDAKSAQDGSYNRQRGIRNKGPETEEPDAGKPARPVLEAGGGE